MKDMIKRIFLVAFILLVLTAISGFFYMQKHPIENNKPAGTALMMTGKAVK
ncbi:MULTISPECIES: hypothetical protein [Chryseobacterium]|uniref:ABC-type uncharacterized transport system permease subunit n=1 Tax=Chryseobacterium camelliae TaxID=1265445 RepID=A0ABU0TDN2_9FLAO|nr:MULTISPECIES: hypothetical protein [Chryseobacterium]MDT3407022.1 ABC-type uncharacterized transport system permease subunit [Pseudacidovorax intermedius]MDQ1095187.1 ABC-type uncharacterized transport system permease subunit [Chryseobacterium camelliae]MDQ1099124.1 ABC-type uncharacterized transport system permease subunit [Chryseobacterium sp. SORGH_AS_1048]MDR6086473.1 ABC-type uncharacterized transport system permease subunit [Chryseobacterium sp. SORGH_AS_0909]MDR6130845.1 ABC-type unc